MNLAAVALSLFLSTAVTVAWAQAPNGRVSFQSRCSGCHGADGNGGEHAPSIRPSLATKNDDELKRIIREGVPRKGMPAFQQLPETELGALIAHMRSQARGRRGTAAIQTRVRLVDGEELEGQALGITGRELQLRTAMATSSFCAKRANNTDA